MVLIRDDKLSNKPAIFLIKFNSGHTTQGSAKFSGKVYFGPSEFPIYYRRY